MLSQKKISRKKKTYGRKIKGRKHKREVKKYTEQRKGIKYMSFEF